MEGAEELDLICCHVWRFSPHNSVTSVPSVVLARSRAPPSDTETSSLCWARLRLKTRLQMDSEAPGRLHAVLFTRNVTRASFQPKMAHCFLSHVCKLGLTRHLEFPESLSSESPPAVQAYVRGVRCPLADARTSYVLVYFCGQPQYHVALHVPCGTVKGTHSLHHHHAAPV